MSSPAAVDAPVPGPSEPFDLGASDESLARLRRWFPEYGGFFRVYSPQRRSHTYLVLEPDDVKRVLVTNHRNYTKGVGTDQITILLGRGIMTSAGDFWHRQRRMLQPAFHRRVLDHFGPAIAGMNERHADRWAALARRGDPVNVTEAASELTLDINLSAIFGRDLEFIRERFGQNPFDIVHTEGNRDLRFAYRIRSLGAFVRDLIARRRADTSEHFDFFGMALAARDKETGQVMDDRQLVDEVLTLVVAGHETTASALTWAWYHLGRHPEIQEELAATAAALPGGRPLSLEDTENWTFGQQVLKESLRLSPPGWMMTRRNVAPDVLHGTPIPAGTDVFVSPFLVHRHPAHWSGDVERFDPGRFSEAESEKRHRFAYIPFGAGPRHCIGENLAMYELALHAATMARRFRLRSVDHGEPTVEARINYRLRSDLWMRVEER
jgi:cytochrome P450